MSKQTKTSKWERTSLISSQREIRLALPAASRYQEKLMISAADGSRIQGVATADDHRILLANASFSGRSCQIRYGFDLTGLAPGDVIRANIAIISNLCELIIPVEVTVTEEAGEGQETPVSTLDEFAALAKDHQREAFRIFAEGRLESCLVGRDASHRALYRVMSKNPVTYQHMEEFLVACGKKEPISFSISKEQHSFVGLDKPEKDTLYVYKDGAGHVSIEVETVGDFIRVDKKQIDASSFVGNVCDLDYVVDPEKIGSGYTRGMIILHCPHQRLVLQITATHIQAEAMVPDHEVRKAELALLRGHEAFLLGRKDAESWAIEAEKQIRALRSAAGNSVRYLLYQAYQAYRRGDMKQTMEILWPVKDGSLTPSDRTEEAAYLVLAKATGLLPEEKREILPALAAFYREEPENYYLFFLIRWESNEAMTQEEIWEELSRCFEAGGNSPFLFLEACKLLDKNEKLLRKLSPFALRLLLYAARNDMLKESMLLRAAFLSHNLKRFESPVFSMLANGYEARPSDEVLEAVLALILKGQPIRKEYAKWYLRAIERGLRITNLYEYYMESVQADSDQRFPLPVLMYFANADSLGERRKALLYASVIKHREEEPEVYDLYLMRMRKFALASIEKSLVGEDFALLYQTFFADPQDARSAALLSNVLFSNKLVVKDPGIREVIIAYEGIEEEKRYPLKGGVAYPEIYQARAAIAFEDVRRRRLCTGISYELTPLLDAKELIAPCLKESIRNTGLLLSGCGAYPQRMHVTEENLAAFRIVAEHEAFTDAYRQEIRKKILAYYLGRPEDFGRIDFINQLDVEAYAKADKAGTVSLLTAEGRSEAAFSLLAKYGYEEVSLSNLLQIARQMIDLREAAYDEELLCLVAHVFDAGKYDETMLSYLCSYYDGPVDKLAGIWKCCRDFQMDSYALEEKILRQSVFANAIPPHDDEILQAYLKSQGNPELAAAFLSQLSYAHLLADRPLADGIYTSMEILLASGAAIGTGAKICLLAHYAKSGDLDQDRRQRAEALLDELNARGVRFAFYQNFPHSMTEKYQLADKLFVEARFSPGSQVLMHYREQGAGERDWIRTAMREIYPGLFSQELTLFYGERLQYFLSVTEKGETRDLPVQSASIREQTSSGRSRYALINQMLKARAQGRGEEAEEALSRFLWQEAFVERFFEGM